MRTSFIRTKVATALVVVVALAFTVGATQELHSPARANADALSASDAVAVTVGNSVTHVLKEGSGWNASNVWGSENKVDGGITWGTTQWNTYNNLVKFLHPQVVRVGVELPYWSPSYGTYTYNSSWMQNLYKQLDAYKAQGVDVELGNWWVSSNDPDNFWWSETTRNGSTDPDSFKRNDLPYDNAKFAEALVAGVKYLITTKGYTNIKYLSLWNEPDWNFVSANASYPADPTTGTNSFWPIYASVNSALTTAGIRSQIAVVGPETEWINRYAPNIKTYVKSPAAGQPQQFGQVVDGISVHDYDSFPDFDQYTYDHSRTYPSASSTMAIVDDMRSSVNATYSANSKPAPFYFVSECCNTMYGPTYTADASSASDDGLFAAEMTSRYLADGVDGVMRWNLTTTSQGGLPDDNGFVPISYSFADQSFDVRGESFYSGAIISRYLAAGSSVYSTTVTGAGSPARVFATSIKRPDGAWTVYLVNDDYSDRQADLDLSALGISSGTSFYQYQWSSGNPNGIVAAQSLAYQGRTLNIPLAPRSVTAFTTDGSDFTANSMLTVNQSTGGVTATAMATPVANGGFESGSLTGWITSGSVSATNSSVWSNSGSYLATVNSSVSAGSLSQVVTGLAPGNYVLSAHIRTGGGEVATLGVSNFDGTKNYTEDINSVPYRTGTVAFAIPPGGGSATISVSAPSGGASTFVNVDDIAIRSTVALANGGFENASPLQWSASGTAIRQVVAGARSGSALATIGSSFGAGSYSQTVYGLSPGTYSFSGFVKSDGATLSTISVSGYGGSTVSKSAASTSWQRVSVPFTVPTGSSSATLTYSAPSGGSGTFSNGDDFELKHNQSPDATMTDNLVDFTKMYSHSANLTFDSSNQEFLGYTASRLDRTANSAENIVYAAPTGKTLSAVVASSYFWPGEPVVDFTFATSPDGVTYSPLTVSKIPVADPSSTNWTTVAYTSSSLPTGTKFVKIVFGNTSANFWNPQLSSVETFFH